MKKTITLLCFLSTTLHAIDQSDSYEMDSEYPKYQEDLTTGLYQVVLDPYYTTQLSAEVQSPVTKIYKRMGEDFKKGDILIQLDDTVYQSNLAKAQAVLDKAQTELDGKNRLFQDNVASLFELKEAEANIAIAKADLATAKRDLDSTKLIAPYDGKVVSLNIEEGELPQVGKELIEIIYDRTLLGKLLVPSSLLQNFKIGDTFTIEIPQIQHPIEATLVRISSVIDPSSATIKIEGEIDNSEQELKPGMTGEANFHIETPDRPSDAELDDSNEENETDQDDNNLDHSEPPPAIEEPSSNQAIEPPPEAKKEAPHQELQNNTLEKNPPQPETPKEKQNDTKAKSLENKIWNFFN